MTESVVVVYKGWSVSDAGEQHHPATARFSATRYGVKVGAHDMAALKRIIDQRVKQYPSSGGA